MKFHATDGDRHIERVRIGAPAWLTVRIAHYRSLCGRWMPDDERWAPVPTDVTCATCRRVLAARGASP